MSIYFLLEGVSIFVQSKQAGQCLSKPYWLSFLRCVCTRVEVHAMMQDLRGAYSMNITV
jgi:hypothetical protein